MKKKYYQEKILMKNRKCIGTNIYIATDEALKKRKNPPLEKVCKSEIMNL
jgi:hypothetical protein